MKTNSCDSSPVSPQLLHHIFYFLGTLSWIHLGITLGSKLCHVHFSKLLECEGPTMQARAKAHSAKDRINLKGKRDGSEEQLLQPLSITAVSLLHPNIK